MPNAYSPVQASRSDPESVISPDRALAERFAPEHALESHRST